MTPRYAIYFAPRLGEALQLVGSSWLGRDAESGSLLPQPVLPGFSSNQLYGLTAAPRRYGLHATLKPPFRLAPRSREGDLREAVAAFAGRQPAVQIERLRVSSMGHFLALIPATGTRQIGELAAHCVRHFDRFRASPLAEETERRLATCLTPRQQVLTAEWGYPYVLDEFRFHITLTEAVVDDLLRRQLADRLSDLFCAVLAQPLMIADLCLFAQADRTEPFRLIERYPLKA